MKPMERPEKHCISDFVTGAAIFLTLAAIIAYLFTDTNENQDNKA